MRRRPVFTHPHCVPKTSLRGINGVPQSVTLPNNCHCENILCRRCRCVTVVRRCVGFTIVMIIISRVQVTMLLGDITSALASADADHVYFEYQLESFKVHHFDYLACCQ